jgi:tetratricopeptide (TPR) repeat protein
MKKGKQQFKSPGKEAREARGILRIGVFYALLALVLAAPWFGGLYKAGNKLGFVLLSLLITAVWLGMDTRKQVGDYRLAFPTGLALVILYGVVSFRAASGNAAILGFANWLGFLALFWTWSTLGLSDREKRIVFFGITCNSVLMAVLGLAGLAGLGQALTVVQGRIATAFYYSNATASYIMVGFLVALMAAFEAPRQSWERRLYVFASLIFVAGFLHTMSRGAWLAFLLVVPLMCFSNRRLLVPYFTFLCVIGFGGAVVAAVSFTMLNPVGLSLMLAIAMGYAFLESHFSYTSPKFAYVGLFVVLCGIGTISYAYFGHNEYRVAPSPVSRRIGFIAQASPGEHGFFANLKVEGESAAALFTFFPVVEGQRGSALFVKTLGTGEHTVEEAFVVPDGVVELYLEFQVWGQGASARLADPLLRGEGTVHRLRNIPHRLLPYGLASRISQMSGASLLSDTRMIFYGDGLKLFRESPLLGRGGGAWLASYSTVQSYFYGTTQIHSDPFELLLEVGLLGLILYLIFTLGIVLKTLFSRSSYARIAAVSVLAIVVHSVGEALMGFPAIYFTMFSLLGISVVHVETGEKNHGVNKLGRYALGGGLALLGLLVLLTGTLFLAELEYAVVRDGAGQLSAIEVEKHLLRTIALNPWNAQPRVDLAKQIASRDPKAAMQLLQKAVRLEPHSTVYWYELGKLNERLGNYHEALSFQDKSLALQPMNIQSYEIKAFLAAEAALTLAPTSHEESEFFAHQVIETYGQFVSVRDNTDPNLLRRSGIPFQLSTSFNLAVGQAYVMLGEYEKAEPFVEAAVKGKGPDTVTNMALLWQAHLKELQGLQVANRNIIEALLDQEAYTVYWQRIKAAPMH